MRISGMVLLTLALLAAPRAVVLQTPTPNPRTIAASALSAAEQGKLAAWAQPWRAQSLRVPTHRVALFALASAERLNYRYGHADSLYAQVIARAPADVFSRQSQLARIAMNVAQGHQNGTAEQAAAIAQAALRDADTLTALDALLTRAAIVLRTGGVNAAASVIARGDSLNWKREPLLDASARCRLANMKSRSGDRDNARRLSREGEAIAMKAGLQRLAGNCAFILATEFARAGLTDSLRSPLTRAIEIQTRTGDMAGLAASTQWAGYYNITLGRYDWAQEYLATAWNAAERAHSIDGKAWTALNRASLAMSFFDLAGAHTWLSRTDSLMRILGDLNGSFQVSRMRWELATATGDFVSARRYVQEVATLADKLGDPQLKMSSVAAQNQLAMHEMRFDDVRKFTREEERLILSNGLTGWLPALRAAQAELALRLGDGREAERLLVPILDSIDVNQHQYRHELEVRRALAMLLQGNTRGAVRIANNASSSFDAWRSSLGDSTLRLYTVQSQRENGAFMSALVARLADAGEVETAFLLAERRRARDLHDRLLLASSLQRPNAAKAQLRREPDSTSIAELQRSIPDSATAVITMNAGEDGARGTAFVLTRNALKAHAIPSVDSVGPHVRRLVSLLEAGRDASADAQALGGMLIAPVLPTLERAGIRRIVFVPEGVLHRLPFDVIRLTDGRALIERFETSVAPSASVLARLRAASQPERSARVLALADPASTRTATSATAVNSGFGVRLLETVFGARVYPALAGARDEAARVQRALPATTIRSGSLASEAMLKRDAASFTVLHFATHAIVDEWSGAQAALALTAGGGDDGLLESGEIASLRLKASLVMLSACRTVGGEVLAGEGVRGLTTAFLQAGARAVIATSWRVDDRAIAPLVGEFYGALARGATTGFALREARLAAMRRGAPVSVWGAFSIVGDATGTIVQGRQ